MNDKEIWLGIKDFEYQYQVSNLGRVKSLQRIVEDTIGRKRKLQSLIIQSILVSDYLKVPLSKDSKISLRYVHILVAETFLGHETNGHNIEVHHKNGIKTDNRVTNLELISHRKNISLSKTGTSKYTGVHWDKTKGKWVSKIYISGQIVFLGHFDNEYEAHLAYENKLKTIK